MNFTEQQLNLIAQELALKYFDTKLNIPVELKNRMDGGTMGSFVYNKSLQEPRRILISGRANKYRNPISLIDTLLHELTHWYCFITKQNFRDGDKDFEDQLKRVGASSTGTAKQIGDQYELKCNACKKSVGVITSKRKIYKYLRGYSQGKYNHKTYFTSCCKAEFIQGEVIIVDDKYTPNEKMKSAYKFVLEVLEKNTTQYVKKDKRESEIKSVATQSSILIEQDNELIIPGKRGVTNKQMIPAIEKHVMDNNKENLIKLKEQYPEVFESSRKYIKKSLVFRFNQILD